MPFSALVRLVIAFMTVLAGAGVGCVMNFVLKKTVSEILLLCVPFV